MADTKLTGLDAITSVSTDDLLYVVDDPSGTPVSKKITVANLGLSGLTDWTPTVYQGQSVTVTIGSAKYICIGNLCFATARLTVTGSGITDNQIRFGGLPQTPLVGCLGEVIILDQGTAWYTGLVYYSGSVIVAYAHNTGDAIGKQPNFGLANTDNIMMNLHCPF